MEQQKPRSLDHRFIELSKTTGFNEEVMTFTARSDSRPLVTDPIGKTVTLVKANLALEIPLVINSENKWKYYALVGEANVTKKPNGDNLPFPSRNRFHSSLNNGVISGHADDYIMHNPTRFCLLPEGEYTSIEDIVTHLKIYNRDQGAGFSSTVFEVQYEKHSNSIKFVFGQNQHGEGPMGRSEWIDTFFMSRALTELLDSEGKWFKSWHPDVYDSAFLQLNNRFVLGMADDDEEFDPQYDEGIKLQFWDYSKNYEKHLTPGTWKQVDLDDTLRFDIERYSTYSGEEKSFIVKEREERQKQPLTGYPHYAPKAGQPDRYNFMNKVNFLTVPFNGMKNIVQALRLVTRGLNQEQTQRFIDGSQYPIEDSTLAHITVSSNYELGQTIEYIPQLDLQSYELIGTSSIREFSVDVYVETTDGVIFLAKQSKDSISMVLLKIAEL